MYTISVFVSHSWNYTGHYDTLAKWIFDDEWNSNGTPILFLNKSIPKDDPIHYARNAADLQRKIFAEIAASDVLVCPTGMYATHSNWIEKELGGAKLHRKPILAVDPWAQERKSSTVVQSADKSVGWNKKTVVCGIWDLKWAR